MPGGRPTKLTQDTIVRAQEFLDTYMDNGYAFPCAVGLAQWLGVVRSTVHLWAKGETPLHAQFSDMLDLIQEEQHRVLWERGMNGSYNANLVKLALTKHNYSDKVQNEHSGPEGGPIEQDHHWTVDVVGAENATDADT